MVPADSTAPQRDDSAPGPLPPINPGRPTPRVGDRVWTLGAGSRIKLRFYTTPPSVSLGDTRPERIAWPALEARALVGTVVAVDDVIDQFVTVAVRHPDTDELAWVNVWTPFDLHGNLAPRGIRFAVLS